MAIQKDRISTAVREMTQNPDWRQILMDAPGAANMRIALAFYASRYLKEMTSEEKDEYREFREMLEATLTAEELEYLAESFARMGFEPARAHYAELLAAKPQNEQEAARKSYSELMEKAKRNSGEKQPATGEGGQEEG